MFDPMLKTLCDAHPRPWIDLICRSAGLPAGMPASLLKPSVPSKSFEADRAYRIELPEPIVLHAEFESSWQSKRPSRFFVYNTLLERDQECPVLTVVFLLRSQANSSDLTGERRSVLPNGEVISHWNYRVVRLWEFPAQLAMESPWTMPLATLMNVKDEEVAPLAERMLAEFQKLPNREARDLALASSVLAGLRFDEGFAKSLFSEVGRMKESTVYQAILREGREEGREQGMLIALKKSLIQLGQFKLGVLDDHHRRCIESATELVTVEHWINCVAISESWNALLEE